jgi:predicted nucleotidyltransferase
LCSLFYNIGTASNEYKSGLETLYGDRLRGVYLFSSYARGEQDAESDVDILIVLSTYERYNLEIERTGELTSNLSLNYDVSISRKFIKERDWQNPAVFVQNIRAEAIAA